MKTDQPLPEKAGLLTGLRFLDLKIIGSTWLRFAFRSGGGVFSLFLVVVIGMFIPAVTLSQMEKLVPSHIEGAEQRTLLVKKLAESDDLASIVSGLLDLPGDEARATTIHLLQEHPALLSMALLLMIYIVPFAVSAASFNQTAGDIGTRGLRFLLSRTERPNIFLGRFLAALFFVSMSLVLVVFLVAIYLHFKLDIYPASSLFLWASWGCVSFIFYALPYVALAAWVSCCMRTPFSALAMTYLAALGPTLLLMIAKGILGSISMDLDWLPLLMPWGWKFHLFSSELSQVVQGGAVMVGFTVLFLLAGLMTFRRRDL